MAPHSGSRHLSHFYLFPDFCYPLAGFQYMQSIVLNYAVFHLKSLPLVLAFIHILSILSHPNQLFSILRSLPWLLPAGSQRQWMIKLIWNPDHLSLKEKKGICLHFSCLSLPCFGEWEWGVSPMIHCVLLPSLATCLQLSGLWSQAAQDPPLPILGDNSPFLFSSPTVSSPALILSQVTGLLLSPRLIFILY